MAFRWSFIILAILVTFTFNITGLECRELPHHGFNETLEEAAGIFTEFPHSISEAFDDASGVFGKVFGKLISKKKFLGIESFNFFEKK